LAESTALQTSSSRFAERDGSTDLEIFFTVARTRWPAQFCRYRIPDFAPGSRDSEGQAMMGGSSYRLEVRVPVKVVLRSILLLLMKQDLENKTWRL
jgi:hypothetical protein